MNIEVRAGNVEYGQVDRDARGEGCDFENAPLAQL